MSIVGLVLVVIGALGLFSVLPIAQMTSIIIILAGLVIWFIFSGDGGTRFTFRH